MRHILTLTLIVLLSGVASAQKFQDARSFMAAYRAAIVKDDYGLLNQLVRENKGHIWQAFQDSTLAWCRQSEDPDEKAKPNAEATYLALEMLASINNTVHGNKTLVKRLKWLRSLNADQKKAKLNTQELHFQGDPLYSAAEKERTVESVGIAVPVFVEMIEKAQVAGDAYQVSNACYFLANLHGFAKQHFEACYYFKKGDVAGRNGGHAAKLVEIFGLGAKLTAAAKRGKVKQDLIDISKPIAESKTAYAEALANPPAAPTGAVGETTDGATGAGPKKGALDGWNLPPMPVKRDLPPQWTEHKGFKIKKEASPAKLQTTFYFAAADWQNWKFLDYPKGDERKFLIPGTKIRNDGGKLFLIREGKRPQRLKLGARPKTMTIKKVKYSDGRVADVYISIMTNPSSYQIVGTPFSGSGDFTRIRVRGASTLRGKLHGVEFGIHDANANGVFNDFGQDMIIIGKGKKAIQIPLSKFVNLGGTMFELKVDPSGKALRTKPYDGAMAPLMVKCVSNVMPRSIVASGSDGEGTYYINLMDALDKPIWIIPTSLQIEHGYIAVGKGDKAQSIRIMKGHSKPQPMTIGEKNIIELGGAGKGFTFDFKATEVTEKGKKLIQITGSSLKIYGASGEEYTRFSPVHVLPEVSIRKGKDGPVWLTGKKMRKPTREDYAKDTNKAWHAKTFEAKKKSSGAYSVKLVCDYVHLGHVESDWLSGN